MAATPEYHKAKDGTETWKVRFRTGGRGSKATSRTFHSAKGADTFARLLADVGPERACQILDERADTVVEMPALADWCETHISLLTGVQPDTLEKYRSYVRNDLGTLGKLPVDAVTHEDIARWVQRLSKPKTKGGKPAAGKTVKNKHGFLSAVFARAESKGLVTANPCKGTRMPRTVVEPMVFLTHEEFERFLTCFTPHWQPFVEFLFSTGLRWGEATALQIGDVDLTGGEVKVARAWKKGKILGTPKSSRSRRVVALADETIELLKPLVAGRGGRELVFLNQRGTRVLHATFLENAWLPAVRLANGEAAQKEGAKRIARRRDAEGNVIAPLGVPIGKRPRIHDARHSNAAWLLGDGVPMPDVSAHLGHESITTTVDRYWHQMPSGRSAIRSAISGALGRNRT